MQFIFLLVILLMASLIIYMAYRLFVKRSIKLLVIFCLQLFVLTIAIVSVIYNVHNNNLVELSYIIFGITIPGYYLFYDLYTLIKNLKDHGSLYSFINPKTKKEEKSTGTNLHKEKIKSVLKDKQIPELVREMNANNSEIIANIRSNLSRANAFITACDYDNAYDIYVNLVNVVNTCPSFYYNLGNICYNKGNYLEALHNYNKILEINDNNLKKLNSPKEVFGLNSQKSQAKILYENPKTFDDIKYDEYTVYFNMGNTLYQLNRLNEAVDCYKKALVLNPGLEDARENIARTYIALEKPDEAIKYYGDYVESDKNNYLAHYNLGNLYYDTKKFKKAANEYRESIKLNAKFLKAYELLSKVYIKTKDYEKAVDVLKQLSKLNPDDEKVYYNLGTTYYHMGQKTKAIDNYLKVIKLKPESYKSYYNIAVAYDDIGEYEKAISAFYKVFDLKPDFVDAYNNLGILLSTQGRHLEALDIYVKGLNKNPEEYSLYCNMGITLSEMGKHQEAVEAYKSALEIKPDELEICYYLGAALAEVKKYDEAIIEYKKALQVKPSDGELFYYMATAYAFQNKYEIAVDNLKKAIDLNIELKKDARFDLAFECLREKKEFKEMVS